MATLTGKLVADTYKALLKLIDNDVVTATEKQVSDGYGGGTGLFIDQNGFIRASKFTVTGGNSSQFLKGDGSLDSTSYLSVASASSTYLTIANAASTYLPIGSTTSAIAEGSRLYFTEPRVLATPLTGFVSTSGNVTSSDTVLSSIEKIWWNIVNGGGGGGGGYVPYVGATQDLNLGTYGLISDFIQLNTTNDVIPTSVGVMSWNNTDGTANLKLKGGNVTLQIGQEQVARVVNGSGGTLLESNYQVVKIIGAQGQRLQVGLAQADNDANSKDTIGIVTETIANNQEGFVTTSGLVNEIDTTGDSQGETWVDGDTLYLSGTTAGAITNVKPQAPTHTVIVGFVVYAHQNHGKIFVKVDNGYELDELHNVQITSVADKNILVYDSTLMVWQNQNIFGTQGYLPFYDDNLLMKDSVIYTNGTNVGIGSTTLTEKLVVNGNILASQFKRVGGLSTQFLKADGSIDSTQYQPYSADLTAIDNLALTTGLLRKNGTDTWELDQTEYISLAYGTSTYQTYANLSSNLTASATKYPSVNAVNTGLGLKLNLTGGTLTGDLTLNYSYPKIALSDISSGTIWNIENDGSTFELNYGATNKFYIFSSGNAAFSNDLTANKFIKAGGLSTEFLKADGSVDSTNYQPYDQDLTAIGALALTTGLLRKNGTNTWELDQSEYITLAYAGSTYQLISNLSSNLTASSTKYPSVNAVNSGLNLRLALTGGTLTGDLALSYSIPTIQLSDTSSGTIWNIQNDGGGFEINSGITNKFVMLSSGNATFVNDLTANKFIKSGGTSAQFLMADGSVSSGNAGTVTSVGLSAPSGFSVSGSPVTSSGTLALGFAVGYSLPSDATQATWTAKQNALNGTGFVKIVGTTISYDNSTYYLESNPSGYISGITSGMVTTALGYTPVTNARQLTINGTTYDLSADRSWTISGTIGGLTSGYIPKATSASTLGNSLIYDNGTQAGFLNEGQFAFYAGGSYSFAVNGVNVPYFGLASGVESGGSGNATVFISGYDSLKFYTTNSERMRITSAGNLLVGTTTDSGERLFVQGIIRASSAGVFGEDVTAGGSILIKNTINAYAYQNFGANSGYGWQIGKANNSTGIAPSNGFYIYDLTNSVTRMVISQAGNLGIGTTSPGEKLQVDGSNVMIKLNAVTDTFAQLGYYENGTLKWNAYNDYNTDNYVLGNSGGARFTLTQAGNLGLGVTPSAWSLGKAFEINSAGNSVWSYSNDNIYLTQNSTFNGGWYYGATATAAQYVLFQGKHLWMTAPSGSAGTAISFTQAMTLNANGNLGVGTTSPTDTNSFSRALDLNGPSGSAYYTRYNGSSTIYGFFGQDSATAYLGTATSPLVFYINSAERARITSGGNVLIGTTTDSGYKLDVNGTGIVRGDALYVYDTGSIQLGRDTTYSTPYMALGFGGRSNGFNKIYGARDTTDGIFISSATGRGINMLVNGNATTALTITSSGAATFSSSVSATKQFINTTLDYGNLNITGYNNGGINIIDQRTGVSGLFSSGITFRDYYLGNSASIDFYHNQYFGVGVNRIGFSFLGSEKLSILYNGNVGIGTTSPTVKLQVENNSHNYFQLNSTVANVQTSISAQNIASGKRASLTWEDGTRGDYGDIYSSTYLSITTGTSEKMRITSGGNVSIGNTNNTYKLDVTGSTYPFKAYGDNGNGIILNPSYNYYDAYNHIFRALSGASEYMRISNTGNVLIGTTTDSGYKLDVNGTGRVLNSLYVRSSSYPSNYFTSLRSDSSANGILQLGNNNINYILAGNTFTGGFLAIRVNVSDETLTSGSEAMRILANGNLLIGTTTDAGYKLYLNGTLGVDGAATFTGNINVYKSSPNISLSGASGTSAQYNINNSSGTLHWAMYSTIGGGGVQGNWQLYSAGKTGGAGNVIDITPAGASTFSSSITASSFFESSDKTIKTLLVDNYQTKGIESITAKLYTKNGKEELGYFAQDVQGILPSSVTMGTNGLLNLSYREVLVAKVQSLEQRVLELETQLNLR